MLGILGWILLGGSIFWAGLFSLLKIEQSSLKVAAIVGEMIAGAILIHAHYTRGKG